MCGHNSTHLLFQYPLPENGEYFISSGTNERIVFHGASLESLTLYFTDGKYRLMSSVNSYAFVIAIDFIER